MKKFKIFILVGTRPEAIRLSEVIKEAARNPSLELVLAHTGQNYDYELNKIFFEDLNIPEPNYFLNCETRTPAAAVGDIITKVYDLIKESQPDAFLVLGDTNSCLGAYAAKRLKVPIFHIEAGNRCFDLRVPEEINRMVVDAVSDINMTYSKLAKANLMREGFDSQKVIVVGSPMFEVLKANKEKIQESSILERLGLEKSKYILASIHREENLNLGVENIIKALNSLSTTTGLPVIVSTHPRTRKILASHKGSVLETVRFLDPFGFHDYNRLQLEAYLVASDSGTISEESDILGIQALNLRLTHERPEAVEDGGPIMTGLNPGKISSAILYLKELGGKEFLKPRVEDYRVDNFSEKVLKIILSYTGYVNEYTWRKMQ